MAFLCINAKLILILFEKLSKDNNKNVISIIIILLYIKNCSFMSKLYIFNIILFDFIATNIIESFDILIKNIKKV
jgi:hypothetical protein